MIKDAIIGFLSTIGATAPSQPAVPQGWTDADSDSARLALELECLLMDTKDLSVVSKWWASANEALELHRQRLAATPSPEPAPAQGEPFGHFRAEPFGWTDCAATDDGAIALYEHPMTNPWRDAVIEQLESWHIYVPAIHDNSPRLAIKALVNMECKAALDPAVSSEAAALAAQGVQAHTPAVPQGWKLVPVEPTPEMIRCAEMWDEGFEGAYARALAATPAPAPAQEVGLTDEERTDMACAVAAICTGASSRTVAATAIAWTERALRAKGQS